MAKKDGAKGDATKDGGKSKGSGHTRIPGRGKKYSDCSKQVDKTKIYPLAEALGLIDKISYAKFDETVDVAFKLGVDPKQSDQTVRGSVLLPHGTGKSVRIIVFAKGDKAKEAQEAGADEVGAEELIEKVSGGWMEFEKVIATPDMMMAVSKLGKVLGPRGMMPNPKLGQVTFEVGKAVSDQKAGKAEYRAEKSGIVHVAIGKKSFGAEKLKANFGAVVGAVMKAKPPTSKGTYLQKVVLSTTMSPGVVLDVSEVAASGGY